MVFAKLLRRTRPALPAIPEGQRVYAVGDIHGRLDLLERLLGQVEADDRGRGAAETQLIFLGDYVDRGPASCGVIDRLIALRDERPSTRFLIGNHEQLFLKVIDGDESSMRSFLRIGGRETLFSYGIEPVTYRSSSRDDLLAMIPEHVPAAHRAFLASLESMIELGDYLFVHAGIKPGRPLHEQTTSELCWIRGEFLDHRESFGRIVVHGHTVMDEPDVRSNRIGIDTGAFETGRLTALGLEGGDRWFLATQPMHLGDGPA
jgi:serine/threonine protein phosphatase 1